MMPDVRTPGARAFVLQHPDDHREGKVLGAVALTAVVLVAEVAGGLWTGSLALLSDAAHVLMDVVALGLSYVALRLAARDPSERHSYGLHRAEVLAAVINGATLILLSAGIVWEAIRRFRAPEPVKSLEMLLIAAAGLLVNLIVLRLLRGDAHGHARGDGHGPEDLNVRSAWLHVLGDTLSSVGVIAAGAIMWRTGWMLLDPIVSLAIGLGLLWGAGRLLRSGIHILMEGVPEGLELAQVSRTMAAGPGVQDVHDLHIWSLCPGAVALSAHATVDGTGWEEIAAIQGALKAALRDGFRIEHTTIQIECTQCSQGVAACVNS